MNTRCYHCGWSFSLSREQAAGALAELKASGSRLYVAYCPKCRRALKIPLEQIERAVPNPEAVVAAPAPAPAVVPAAAAVPAPEPPATHAKPHHKRGVKPAAPAAKKAVKKPAAKKPAAKSQKSSSTAKTKKGKKP